jgi:hypothetical protein
MIDLGRPALHAEGVTLFPDHANLALFHYLADAPRLRTRTDGSPELSLFEYRLDGSLQNALGAGLLELTLDLGVDDQRLASLRSRLSGTGVSKATLAPVAPDAGTCTLVLIDHSSATDAAAGGSQGTTASAPATGSAAPATGSGPATPTATPAPAEPALVERILGGTTPELFGDLAVTFMATLSPDGVNVVEGALRGGGLPAGVVYNLQVTAIRPALRARVTARWADAYDFYDNRLHGGKLLLAVDIGPTVEDLVRAEVIQVEIDELVPADEQTAAQERAVQEVQRYVLEELFTPTLGQVPPPADQSTDALTTIGTAIKDFAGFFSVTYSLRKIDRRELKTLTYDLATARAETITLSPQGTLPLLLSTVPAATLEQLIVHVPPTPSPEMRFDIGMDRDLDVEEIDHVDVTVSYGAKIAGQVTLDGSNPRRQLSVWFDATLGPTIEYEYEVHFRPGPAGDGAMIASSSPQRTDDRIIRIDPRELYRRVVIDAVAQGVPFDRYPQVLLDVRVTQPPQRSPTEVTLTLTADNPEASFALRAALGTHELVQRRVRYVDSHGQTITIDWALTEPGVLVVADPLPDVIDVELLGAARFGTAVARLIVELRPHADPTRIETRVLTAESPSARWSFAVGAGADRGYDYRVTIHTTANEVREGKWLTGTPGELIVGEGIARLRQVQVVFVGRSLADLGLLAVKLRFSFTDPQAGLSAEDERLVQDLSAPVQWSYPVADPAREAYAYQLTLVHADGRMEQRDPVTTADLLVVIPLV